MPDYRSVSQRNQYDKCGYAYYLSRIAKAWERPAAWLPQGTAVHEAAELFEKSGRTLGLDLAQDAFREAYAREVDKYCEQTPNLDYWYASGPYKGEADIERRYKIGLDQTAGYVEYTQQHPEEVIWIAPDGVPAIELSFDIDLDGVPVRGYIDQVIAYPPEDGGHDGQLVVRDLKTGNQPGDTFQLAVYGLAIEDLAGVDVLSGDYWMARNKKRPGGPTKPYDLTEWSREEVTAEFHRIDEGIKAGNFEPDPEPSKCQFCSVRTACEFSQA